MKLDGWMINEARGQCIREDNGCACRCFVMAFFLVKSAFCRGFTPPKVGQKKNFRGG